MSTASNGGSDLRGPIAFLAGGILGAAIFALGSTGTRGPGAADLRAYAEVRDLVEDGFVESRDREELLESALVGMVTELDPYSRFYSGEDLRRVERSTTGTYLGLGLILRWPFDDGVVLFALPGSPAAEAGLAPGDRLRSIDSVHLADLPPGGVEQRLGQLGPQPVALAVVAPDGSERALELTPAEVVDPTVRHVGLLDEGIGYLAITSFSRRTVEEFDAAVLGLERSGLEALLVDLRGNPGGVLRAATDIANRFVAEGPLVTTHTREGVRTTEAVSEEAGLEGLPLLVLVDSDSASASEVLAGALQDHRAAVLVGMSTYGKGTVQTLVPTDYPEGIVKVTTAYYSTPAGRSIDRHYRAGEAETALTPDLLVPLDEDQRTDLRHFLASHSPPPELADAVAELRLEAGLPGSTRPDHDPQLEAALGLLAQGLPR